MTKLIRLHNGMEALVDDEDYDKFGSRRWRALPGRKTWYAVYTTSRSKKAVTFYLHREITAAPKGMKVDHKNGNGLDCRRDNLRVVTTSQNAMNPINPRPNRTGVRGVWFCKRTGRYAAVIKFGGIRRWLGRFDTAEEAGKAYQQALEELNVYGTSGA